MAKKQGIKILKHDFSKGVSVTDHFVKRAQERLGIKDLHDDDRNRNYATSWAMDLLADYDEIESNPDNKDIWLVKCRQIIIVYKVGSKTCLTCYPMSYNTYTKQYDSLKTSIKKRELKLDDFTRAKVDNTFINIYYQEARKYAKDLKDLHTRLAALYSVQSNSSNNTVIDTRQYEINQINSIILEIEQKLYNIRNVVFDVQDSELET